MLDGMYFCLKNISRLDECPEKLNHGVFKKIFEISELRNMDDETRSKVIERMTTERDLRNQMAYAREEAIAEGLAEGRAKGRAEGLAEGLAEGRAEGRADTIRQLLESGMPLDTIAKALDLSAEEIESFK